MTSGRATAAVLAAAAAAMRNRRRFIVSGRSRGRHALPAHNLKSHSARPDRVQCHLERVSQPTRLADVLAGGVFADDLHPGEARPLQLLRRVPRHETLLAFEEEGGGVVAALDEKAPLGTRGAGLVPIAGQFLWWLRGRNDRTPPSALFRRERA